MSEETEKESQISLEDLENRILNHIKKPSENDEILKWNAESTHFPEMIGLIEKPDVNPVVLTSAISYALHHIAEYISSISPQEKIGFVRFLYQLCFDQSLKFSTPEIIESFVNLVAYSIVQCFDQNEEILNLISSLYEPDLTNIPIFTICCSLLAQITNYCLKNSIYSFLDTNKVKSYEYFIAYTKLCLEQNEDQEALFVISKLIELFNYTLKFEVKLQGSAERSKSLAVEYKLSDESRNILLNPEIMQILFGILNQTKDPQTINKTYKVLGYLCDLDYDNFTFIQRDRQNERIANGTQKMPSHDMTPDEINALNHRIVEETSSIRKEYFTSFLEPFNDYLSNYDFNKQTITNLCLLIQKVNCVINSLTQPYDYDQTRFISSVLHVHQPVITIENLLDQTLAAQYIIQFWWKCKGYNSDKEGLFFTFIEVIMNGIMSDPDYADKFLSADEQSLYDELRKLAQGNYIIVFQKLEELFTKATADFYAKIESESPEAEAAILAFLIDFLVKISPTSNNNITSDEAQLLVSLYRTAFEIFDNVFSINLMPPYYVQRTLIMLGDCMQSLNFIDNKASKFYEEMKNVKGVQEAPIQRPEDIYSYVLNHIVNFFSQDYSEELLKEAALLLQSKFKNNKVLKIALNYGAAEKLIRLRESNNLNYAKSYEVRKMIHGALGILLVSTIPSPLDSRGFIKAQYDHVFESHPQSSLVILEETMIDFSGYFSMLGNTTEYMVFFEYLFPEKLDHFINIIELIQDMPPKIFSLLDFWYSLIGNVGIISFKNHSPKGLQLFKISANFVHKIMELIAPKAKAGTKDIASDFMVKMATIFYLLLDNRYTPYNAFSRFSDPALNGLINDFISLIQMYDIDQEMQIPELSYSIMRGIKALCEKHLKNIIEMGHSDIILASVGSYLIHSENPRDACNALLPLLSKIEDITILDHDSFVRVFITLWGHIYRKPSNGQLHEVVYRIYHLYPDIINALPERVLQYTTKPEEYNEEFAQYVAAIQTNEDEDQFSDNTVIFANRTRILINAPHLAFC